VIRAVAKYPELLRVSVAHAGNDHRLGANEAPPAIISIFLGDQLQEVFEQLENGAARTSKLGGTMEIGVNVLPKLPRDAGDRNRTSPFAFTGNKFEFRALGSSQSIAGPNTVLNTIVAESLDFIATGLEKSIKAGDDLNKAIQALLPGIIRESKKVFFNGDGYSEEWHKEAERRGLPNLRNTVDSLAVTIRPETIELFRRYNVFNEREMQSRFNIQTESYIKTIHVESRLTALMARTMVLPAALRWQTEVANAVTAGKSAGADVGPQMAVLKTLTASIGSLQKAIVDLDHAMAHHAAGNLLDHAKQARDAIVPAMNRVRATADELEGIVADDLWPLPTYRELLFVK
jgi:glutamine synthetase